MAWCVQSSSLRTIQLQVPQCCSMVYQETCWLQAMLHITYMGCYNVMQVVFRCWISNIHFHDKTCKASMRSRQVRMKSAPASFCLTAHYKALKCSGAGKLESVASWHCRTGMRVFPAKQHLIDYMHSTGGSYFPEENRSIYVLIIISVPCLKFTTWSLIVLTPVASGRVHRIL